MKIDLKKVTQRKKWIEFSCKFCGEYIDMYSQSNGWRLEDCRNVIESHLQKCEKYKQEIEK